MQVQITYARTTSGRAMIEIDEAELREWLAEADPLFVGNYTGADVMRFLQAGEDEEWLSQMSPEHSEMVDDDDTVLIKVVL